MEQVLINLVAGALGGVGAGKSSPTFDLGTIGNIVSGLVGGGVLGQIVTLLLPSIVAAAQSGNLSIGGIVSPVALAGPYSRHLLAQSKTELLPDGHRQTHKFSLALKMARAGGFSLLVAGLPCRRAGSC